MIEKIIEEIKGGHPYIILKNEEFILDNQTEIESVLKNNNYNNSFSGWKIDTSIWFSKDSLSKLFLFSQKEHYNVFHNLSLSNFKIKRNKDGNLNILTPSEWSTCVNIGKSFKHIVHGIDKTANLKYHKISIFRGGEHAYFLGKDLIFDPALKIITDKNNLDYGFVGFRFVNHDLGEILQNDEHIIGKNQSFVLGIQNGVGQDGPLVFCIGLDQEKEIFIESWYLNGSEKEMYFYDGNTTDGNLQKELSSTILEIIKKNSKLL